MTAIDRRGQGCAPAPGPCRYVPTTLPVTTPSTSPVPLPDPTTTDPSGVEFVAELGDAAVVLEPGQERKVDRRGPNDELADLARAFGPGLAVEHAESGLLLTIRAREPATEDLKAGTHREARPRHRPRRGRTRRRRAVRSPGSAAHPHRRRARRRRTSTEPGRRPKPARPPRRCSRHRSRWVSTTALPPSPYVPSNSGNSSAMRTALSHARHAGRPQLTSEISEHGVVGEHVDLGRFVERAETFEDVAVPHLAVDLGVVQSHREVGATLTRCDHLATAEPFELDVPQPRRISTVCNARVDGEQHRSDLRRRSW